MAGRGGAIKAYGGLSLPREVAHMRAVPNEGFRVMCWVSFGASRWLISKAGISSREFTKHEHRLRSVPNLTMRKAGLTIVAPNMDQGFCKYLPITVARF